MAGGGTQSNHDRMLRQTEEKLLLLSDALPSLVSYVDRDGYYRLNNKAYEDWFQIPRGEITGRRMKDVLGPEAFLSIKRHIDTALRGKAVTFEQSIPRKAGASWYVHATYVPHVSEAGDVQGFFALVEDISERKAAEQALQESEERLRSILDTAPDAIITIDDAGSIESFSPAAEKLFGYQVGEVIGKNVKMLMPPPYSAEHDGYLSHFRATGERKIIGIGREVEARRKDGTVFPINLAVNEMQVEGGRKFTGVVHDISKLRQAESLNSRLGRIIDQAANEILVFDATSLNYILVNRSARENLGYSMSELQQLTCSDLVPDCPPAKLQEMTAALREGHEDQIVLDSFHKRKDGSTYAVEARLQYLPAEQPPVFLVIAEDVTDRRHAEEKLRQAQKMEAIGQLTGGIAHDFNNLLTVITGNLELIGDRLGEDETLRTLLSEASEASDLGAQLTKQLLTFSRRQKLEPQSIDPNELILGMTEMLRRTLGETIDISTVLETTLRHALADPHQLQNALLNLAINARDAMPDGGRLTIESQNVQIDETAHIDVSAGHYVALSVSDTGAGISPELQERVFEPFFTTKETGKGSGLGLSMVYGFSKQSGGHLQLYSEPGHGTVVTIYIPAASEQQAAEISSRDRPDLRPAGGETVLLVEDDVRVRNVAAKQLHHLGYEVIEADNGAAALDILDGPQTIDVLFTDLVMPGDISGLDLIARTREKRPEIKLLLTSGYARDHLTSTEDVPWLRKPYRMADLADALRGVLDD